MILSVTIRCSSQVEQKVVILQQQQQQQILCCHNSMLELRHTTHLSSISCLVEERFYSLVANGSCINVFNSISGQLEGSINTQSLLPPDSTGMNVTGNKLVVFNGQGEFTCFDIAKASIICTSNVKIKQNKMNHPLQTCATRSKDDMIFIVQPGSTTLSALYMTSSSISVRSSIRVPDTMHKNKQDIVKIFCHPSKPLLFICFKKGPVQVFNYLAVRRHLVAKSGSEDSDAGGWGDSDDEDDNNSVDSRSAPSKTKVDKELSPVALLTREGDGSGGKHPSLNISLHHATSSPCGRLFAVCWGTTVSVFSTLFRHSHGHGHSSKKQDAEWRVAPLGSFLVTPTLDMGALGPLAFHPSEPILFQVRTIPADRRTTQTVPVCCMLTICYPFFFVSFSLC